MKRFKVALFLLLAGVAIAGAAFTTESVNRFTTDNYYYSHSTLFQISVSDKELLDDSDKWSSGTSGTGGSLYMSYVSVVYTGTAPSEQQVIDEVKTKYIANGQTFTDGGVNATWSKTINGVSVQFTVRLKNS